MVIGGGDTGTDCVATALRQGCKDVLQIEIMNKPPEKEQIIIHGQSMLKY